MDQEPEKNKSIDKPRAVARRQQVMEAATICFARFGFHSASMTRIAEQAGMSVGHIYRYFTGKEAIIAAIVRDQIDLTLSRFPVIDPPGVDVPAILLDNARYAARQAQDRARATLKLETRAEAARNPAIAKIVRTANAEISARVRAFAASGFPPDRVPEDLDERVEMLGVTLEGVAFRAISHADCDLDAVDRLLELVVAAIFAAP